MEALISLESMLQIVLGAAALGAAAWSARRSVAADSSAPKTGEIAWAAVAVAVLAWVTLAAGIGRDV